MDKKSNRSFKTTTLKDYFGTKRLLSSSNLDDFNAMNMVNTEFDKKIEFDS